ncbi:hypothetical protein NL676_008140 [Syzygium grande]|nr:hypothetical protein NL676_008140 [Syzygium grande]
MSAGLQHPWKSCFADRHEQAEVVDWKSEQGEIFSQSRDGRGLHWAQPAGCHEDGLGIRPALICDSNKGIHIKPSVPGHSSSMSGRESLDYEITNFSFRLLDERKERSFEITR